MGAYFSTEETRKRFLSSFPEGMGALAHCLWNEIVHLHLVWKNYRILFGTSPERIDLLNRTAPVFFALLERALRHDVIMRIARLTDPPCSDRAGKKANASLQRLIADLDPYLDAEFTAELRLEMQELQERCKPIRNLRNKLLAHPDLAAMLLKYRLEPLPGISRADIEEMLEKIRGLMGKIEKRFLGGVTQYQDTVTIGDAEALVVALERAQEQVQALYRRRRLDAV
ncbi:MAG: hypothetical protein QXU79_00690 [Candidatus Micrarchaeaceae archaeon]